MKHPALTAMRYAAIVFFTAAWSATAASDAAGAKSAAAQKPAAQPEKKPAKAEGKAAAPARKAATEIVFERTGGEKAYKVAKGAEFVVVLPSKPNSGYHWLLKTKPDGNVLKLASRPVFVPDLPDQPGGSGTERFTFLAQNSGHATLEWGYQRPWERDQAAMRKAKLTIRVP